MDRTTPLLTLALLVIGAPASASDIDEVSTYDLSASVDAAKGDLSSLQHRSRKATRSAAPARAQAAPAQRARVPATSRTATASRPPVASSSTRAVPRPSAAPRPSTAPRPSAAPARPGTYTTSSRPPTAARPPVVVHTAPGRPVVTHGRPPVVVHTAPSRPVVVHRPVVHTVRYTHVRPYHGIFVYGPRPVTHVHYVDAGPGPVQVQKTDLPERAIDREHSLSLGLKGGSLVSSTSEGRVYGDPGLALVGRYRPAESVGLELALGHHGSGYVDPIGSRSQTQFASSVELFAFPWTRVSPYAIGGVTWNSANVSDEIWNGDGYELATRTDSQWGLHGGLGLELALGNHFALDLEGRYIGWLDERLAGEAPGAIQATAGLQVYFK